MTRFSVLSLAFLGFACWLQTMDGLDPMTIATGMQTAAAGVDFGLDIVEKIVPGAEKYTNYIRPITNTVQKLASSVTGFGGGIASTVTNFFGGLFGGFLPEKKTREPAYKFVPNPENVQKIRDGFAGLEKRLQSITKKTRELLTVITDTTKQVEYIDMITEYRAFQTKLNFVDRRRNKLMGTPSKDHMELFVTACENGRSDKVFEYLHILITQQQGITKTDLLKILTVNAKDRNTLIFWIMLIFGDAYRAAILKHACLGTANPLEETVNMAAEETEKMLSEITRKLQAFHDDKFTEFYKQTVKDYFMSDKDDVKGLQENLTNTYPFAEWMVVFLSKEGDSPDANEKQTKKFVVERKQFPDDGDIASDVYYYVYIAWCEPVFGVYPSKVSVTEILLQKAAAEMNDIYQHCDPSSLKNVYTYLTDNSPAFFEARSQFIFKTEDVGPYSGGGNCSKLIENACKGQYGAVVTFGHSTE